METIGVLLSIRDWNHLRRNKDDTKKGIWHLFAVKAEELNLKIVYFTLQHISLPLLKTEAIVIENNAETKKQTMDIPSIIYNPTKFFQKKYIRLLRELSIHPKFQVINEHHVIKKKNLFELIQAQSELIRDIKIDNEKEHNNAPVKIYVLGQKLSNSEWEIPIIYVEDAGGIKHLLEDAASLLENLPQKPKDVMELQEILYEHSEKLLQIIHYYYPGIYEIGLLFSINSIGQITINSTCSFNLILKDLYSWNQQICQSIFETPLKVAKELLQQKDKSDEANSQSQPNDLIKRNELFSSSIKENKKIKQLIKDGSSVWIKFSAFEDEELTLKLPGELMKSTSSELNVLQFGVKEQPCNIVKEGAVLLKNNTFHTPIEILISRSLLTKLHIPNDIVYQLHISSQKVIIGPTIGLLLGEKNQLYTPAYMEKFSDRLGIYEKFGGLVIAFSSRSIDWEEKIAYGMIYDPIHKKWEYGTAPIPAAIYRRNFHQKADRIKQLIELTDDKLFNSHHYKKSDLLNLQDEKKMKNHLPDTHLYKNMNELIEFVNEKQKVILKPVSLSRGRGIFVIEQNAGESGEGYILYDHRKGFRLQHLIPDAKGLEEMLSNLNIFHEKYLYQTYIPLLKVNNRPFDVRVVMQKYDKEDWICTGIECRVAGENEVLTNIARGGEAMTLEEVVKETGIDLSFEKVQKSILKLCRKFCRLLDKKENAHFAEFGLDIGLDQEGFPWIIEANIFPSFKGFKAMDMNTYLTIRYQPIIYAVHLQGFAVTEAEGGTEDEIYDQYNSNF
ncbi:YheC/YheD family protein [Bacillus sp. FJAT-29814]|uniref:YheC/YheD family endospore coat-associated protein n=1 Tax=Bacillus sp. FJAT-29814 TaxID=1729688 RepID=UPI00082E9D2F|nr:YheC/YheD family protein [Bacillus sp. FJAT-29814]